MSIAEHMNRAMEKAKSKHSEKMGKHRVKEMRIERAESGGFIATHHMDNDAGMTHGGAIMGRGRDESGYKEPTKHALKDGKALMQHVKEHMCPADVEETAVMK